MGRISTSFSSDPQLRGPNVAKTVSVYQIRVLRSTFGGVRNNRDYRLLGRILTAKGISQRGMRFDCIWPGVGYLSGRRSSLDTFAAANYSGSGGLEGSVYLECPQGVSRGRRTGKDRWIE